MKLPRLGLSFLSEMRVPTVLDTFWKQVHFQMMSSEVKICQSYGNVDKKQIFDGKLPGS